MEENGENNKGFFSSLLSEGIKEAWKKIPLPLKLKIIGIIALVFLGIILIVALIGGVQSAFLDFSNEAQSSEDMTAEFEEFWGELCVEDDDNCTEEQKKAHKELIESQKKFFKKLDSLVKKYNISDEQKHLILTTVFYDYDIYEFSIENGAFDIDDTDEINYDVTSEENIYVKEKDSLKELIKQFKVYTANCKYTYNDQNGNSINREYVLRDENEKALTFNFLEYAYLYKKTLGGFTTNYNFWEQFFLVSNGFYGVFDKDLVSAIKECRDNYVDSIVTFNEDSTNQASIENFYDYLITTNYFDEKPHLKTYFYNYGKKNGLDTEDLTTWTDEDLQNVRSEILENIKLIVKDYMGEVHTAIAYGGGSSYWWPIGSAGDKIQDTVSDLPENTTITSYFQPARVINGVIKAHKGVDLAGTLGQTNVIASMGGTVTKVVNDCPSNGYYGSDCGGGYGNSIYIQDVKGNINIYAHLYKDSIKVSKGDVVGQGQVIAKVGNSGSSTGSHLHFEIRINGVAVDPIQYISAENPRPVLSDPYVVAEYVYNTLLASGFSPAAASGVLGNMYAESRFNSQALNEGSGAYGLCQWLGGRKNELMAYGENDINKYTSVELQMEYLLEVDLIAQDSFFKTYADMSISEYKTLTNPRRAGEHYCRAFERPGRTYEEVMDYDTSQREDIAQAFYDRFVNGNMDKIGDLR